MTEKNIFENFEQSDYFELWKFPEFDAEITVDDASQKDVQETAAPVLLVPEEDVELIHLKEILQKKIALHDALNEQLQQTIHQIDQALLEKMIACVKNITKKIIGQQIQEDPAVMKRMLADLLEKVKTHKTCHVKLSLHDFELLKNEQFETLNKLAVVYEPDPELNPGDFKIATPVTDIIAILDDRLNAFFK